MTILELDERKRKFLRELADLSQRHGLYITGCGCCGSPKIVQWDHPNVYQTTNELDSIRPVDKEEMDYELNQMEFEREELGSITDGKLFFGDIVNSASPLPEGWQGYWEHNNGYLYEVLMLANNDSVNEKYPPTVIYRSIKSGKVWARPLSEWDRSMRKFPTHDVKVEE